LRKRITLHRREPKKLLGTVSPQPEGPSFAIPVFYDSLGIYVQNVDENETIVGFDEVHHPGEQLHKTQLMEERSIGDRALWAVDFGNGEVLIGFRPDVVDELRNRSSDYLDRPFFLLDVGEFIGDKKIIHRALLLSAEKLEKMSRDGARNWLASFSANRIAEAIARYQRLQERIREEKYDLGKEIERKQLGWQQTLREIAFVGRSTTIKKVLSQVKLIAETASTVLISGETGTGKELLARIIHNSSSRGDRPMVRMNCSAIPPSLIEHELFGFERGAFTGASTKRAGFLEVADGGTILIDEIDGLPLDVQAKLLRVLEDGKFERCGGAQTVNVDVRVIATTNTDLGKLISQGVFREDLYYRLSVFTINVPPLRERLEDIPPLVWKFVQECEQTMGRTIETIPRESLEGLQRYSWPGNVRELRNVIERAMLLSTGSVLQVELPLEQTITKSEGIRLEELEKQLILDVLQQTDWHVRGKYGAAEILGLTPHTLIGRMKKLRIMRST